MFTLLLSTNNSAVQSIHSARFNVYIEANYNDGNISDTNSNVCNDSDIYPSY